MVTKTKRSNPPNSNKSVFGWNRDDTFEVVRTQSNNIHKKWWVSLCNRYHQCWHSKAEYTEAEAKVLFDHLCTLPGPLLQAIMEELLRTDWGLEKIG
jgi:hypothetical protein